MAKKQSKAKAVKSKEMSPERYFLLYAYPCSFVLVDIGKITDEKRKELEKKLINNEKISKKELEKIFVSAFRRLRQIAKEKRRSYWDMAVIKEYFFGEKHNEFIDKQDGMYAEFGPTIRELCKVHKAEVLEKRDNVLSVKYDSLVRNVFATLTPGVKLGDKVTVHWAFAIEKIA